MEHSIGFSMDQLLSLKLVWRKKEGNALLATIYTLCLQQQKCYEQWSGNVFWTVERLAQNTKI